ncbi:MAG: N-acetylmuramoyl-L-alanine amidase [Bacilli bacterium]|nr:N-acetylmuramoyl-L-alanine amidase [Bacilli bacterium]MDD4298507.1 N-acetylmuramoyl-L-alanine amidase [Bacilli bacterium]
MKRYRTIMIVIVLFLLAAMNKVNSYVEELPLLGKVIYIDPGHGGPDPGANYKDILEKDINLEISKLISTLLVEKGAIVYMTREYDYDLAPPHAYLRKRSDLSRRIKMINDSMCDVYLSIHLNATTSPNWKGAQVFYDNINDKNIILGTKIQDSFKARLGSRRKLKEIHDLYMYKDITRPGVLLELGFLSNPNERYILRKYYYQKRVSNAIIEGLINYFRD